MKITVFDEPINQIITTHDGLIFDYPTAKVWNLHGVSLQNRLAAQQLKSEDVKRALAPANLKGYLVPASMEVATRCIDGRIRVGWQPNGGGKVLGPKIAGGTAHAALAHRIVDVDNLRQDLLFEADILHVIKQYKVRGIGFGGHIDDHQQGHNTGCGAVDNINLILNRLQRPEPQEQLRSLAKMILGDAYDNAIVNEVIGRMLYLDALKPRYMPKAHGDPDGEFLYKQTIVTTLRQQADGNEENVPALAGSHNEVAVIINFIADQSFDSDRFSADHNNQIQAFGWDVWEMYEEANSLYPYNMSVAPVLQRKAIEDRLKHITTRTLLGLATLMVLTDGSLKLIMVE